MQILCKIEKDESKLVALARCDPVNFSARVSHQCCLQPCRRAKMKCDEQRPCSTCKSRDISHRCIDEVLSRSFILVPLLYLKVSFETIRGVLKLPVVSKEVIEIRPEQKRQGSFQQRSIEL